MEYFVVGPDGQHKITGFRLGFANKERTVFAAFQYQAFGFFAGEVAVEPSMGERRKRIDRLDLKCKVSQDYLI